VTPERPGNYAEQARTYDRTRAASPTVVRLLAKHLGDGEGRRLADLAGGTGNYAQVLAARGFDVLVVDAQPAMLARSVSKIGPGRQVAAELERLPLADTSVDCATLVSALHLIADPMAALRECRRLVWRGPFVLQAFTRENMEPIFVFDYFPGTGALVGDHATEAQVLDWLSEAGFSRVVAERYVYLDGADGSLPALHTDPLRLAGPAYLRNNSWYHRIPDEVRREGLARLEADLRTGVLEERIRNSLEVAVRVGHGTVFAAWP
jgi:ubiquinone/menaquinone biosynthesis C-methylase UbiE